MYLLIAYVLHVIVETVIHSLCTGHNFCITTMFINQKNIYLLNAQPDIFYVAYIINKFIQSPRNFQLSIVGCIIHHILGKPNHGSFFVLVLHNQLQVYCYVDFVDCLNSKKSH